MSDPAAQTMKKESTATTNQIRYDRDDSSESDSHKELLGEYDEPSAKPTDVESRLNPKEDGEMIEKKNENAQTEEEEKKERQDMECLGQEHQPGAVECLKGDRLNIEQPLNEKSLQGVEEPQKMGPLKPWHEMVKAEPRPMEMRPLDGVQLPKAEHERMEEELQNEVQPPKAKAMEEELPLEPKPMKVESKPMEVEPLGRVQPLKAEVMEEELPSEPKPMEVEPEPMEVKPKPMEVEPLGRVQPPKAEVMEEELPSEPKPMEVEPEPMEVEPEPLEVKPKPMEVEPEPMEVEPLKPQPDIDPPPPPIPPSPVVDERRILLGALVAAVLGIIIFKVLVSSFDGTQIPESRSVLQVFQDEFKSLEDTFPKQTRDLWLRSEKLLQNQLKKSHPREPATIILTAAQDAKDTLLCLGASLAQAYSVALDAKWLMIDGPSEAKYDSGTAKLHIDELLSSGFESTARAAVLSRLETLPSGSLLILYKYCDHENAAYKNVTLVLTVLLDEPSLERETPLPDLEEKVRDFLYERFITSDGIRSHNEMDRDKLGGVWSRISHLVLPVLPVSSIETGSCPLDYTVR